MAERHFTSSSTMLSEDRIFSFFASFLKWLFCVLWLVVLGIGAFLFWRSGVWHEPYAVTLTVNGHSSVVMSREATVGTFLDAQGYQWLPEDIIYPLPTTPLTSDLAVTLILARDMTLRVDGQHNRLFTHMERVDELLAAHQIVVGSDDLLLLNDRPISREARLPFLALQESAAAILRRPRGELTIRRAVSIEVDDDGMLHHVTTRDGTVGEALLAEGINLYEGDHLSPSFETPITDGLKVEIRRTIPLQLSVDGETVRTRTAAQTVGAFITASGFEIKALDLLSPSADTPVSEDLAINLTRIKETLIVEREAIPFESRTEFWADMELDTEGLVQVGEEGIYAREYLVLSRDGVEQERKFVREYVEKPPQDEIYGYGTKIVLRTVNTPEGPRQYWRKIRMVATSYTAATSGKTRDHPAYGITKTGIQAGFGVVAVDPNVVDLRTYVYVPDYGIGYAGDTGGAIKGRRIDLGYDEWNLKLWYSAVDVYLLAPPPDDIRYVLP